MPGGDGSQARSAGTPPFVDQFSNYFKRRSMRELFHFEREEAWYSTMLRRFVLFHFALIVISAGGSLAMGDPAQKSDNDPETVAALPPAQHDGTSNVPQSTKQADHDFLKQVEAWDA